MTYDIHANSTNNIRREAALWITNYYISVSESMIRLFMSMGLDNYGLSAYKEAIHVDYLVQTHKPSISSYTTHYSKYFALSLRFLASGILS